MKQLLSIGILLFSISIKGQINTLSPLSYYGVGDPATSSTTNQAGMGHTFIGVLNSGTVNDGNPASYTDIRWPAFNADARSELLTLSDGNSSQTNSISSLQHFAFGFPLFTSSKYKRKGGFAFGISPYTRLGYNIAFTQNQADLGDIQYVFNGTGGLNNVFMGYAYDLLSSKRDSGNIHNLSFGANINYLFGQLDKFRLTQFNNAKLASNLMREESYTLSDYDFKFGLMYRKNIILDRYKNKEEEAFQKLRIKKRSIAKYYKQSLAERNKIKDIPMMLSMGLFVRPQSNINTFYSSLNLTYQDSVPGIIPIDTLSASSGRGVITNPLSFGFGFCGNFNNKLVIAADYSQTLWSSLSFLGLNSGMFNSSRVSAGIEYAADIAANSKTDYAKLIRYRLGASYERSLFNVNGAQPYRYGINFGFGLPFPASWSASMLNFSGEYAMREGMQNLNEQYFILQFGFVVHPNLKQDFWFSRRKYD